MNAKAPRQRRILGTSVNDGVILHVHFFCCWVGVKALSIIQESGRIEWFSLALAIHFHKPAERGGALDFKVNIDSILVGKNATNDWMRINAKGYPFSPYNFPKPDQSLSKQRGLLKLELLWASEAFQLVVHSSSFVFWRRQLFGSALSLSLFFKKRFHPAVLPFPKNVVEMRENVWKAESESKNATVQTCLATDHEHDKVRGEFRLCKRSRDQGEMDLLILEDACSRHRVFR